MTRLGGSELVGGRDGGRNKGRRSTDGKKIMMLHVFNVDAGNMLFFDVLMCAELVSVLQEHIFNVTKIPINKQVLLVSGGIALLPTQRVCAYPVGTDTNPIFLYNKQYYLHPGSTVPLDLMVLEDGPELSDLQDEVDEGLALGDSMNALVLRAHLAFRLCGMSQVALQACQRLVHEQHLQHQGFMIAIANMSLTVPGAKSKTEEFLTVLQEFLEKKATLFTTDRNVAASSSYAANGPMLRIQRLGNNIPSTLDIFNASKSAIKSRLASL
ncbi:RB1-inducible coiled-coil protein 1-like [Homalodisca vitripennis]|uniref:RB1-inducible coiled-coil protein 1-like n=1 Tax=Homalodisca vitripennis TaxID=197043 RepID=UPI001EEAC2E9|nr:RB1-inducible coiled-coil protein 1-like [Homalodisca vitripennis]